MEDEILKAEDNLNKLNEILNEYDKLHGILIQRKPEAEQFLNLEYSEIKKLSGDDCGEMALILGNYSAYLQKEQNRQSAIVKWCESVIDITIGKSISSYKTNYQTFEELKLLAVQGNSYTKKLNELRIKAQSRLSEIYGMSSKIDSYVEILIELQRTRRKNHAN
jgi:hypothetical protein